MKGPLGRLRIERPVVFFDLETTGVDQRQDRIVEISILKVFPPGPDGTVPEPVLRTRRLNPGMPIPPGATAIHGITDADVADEPSFLSVAKSLAELLEGADFAGFNIRMFDLPLLEAEFRRAGVPFDWRARHVIDAKDIFHFKEPRTLSAAYALYCGGELKSAHSAEGDVLATREVLIGQLERYEDLPDEVAALAQVGAPKPDPDAIDAEGKFKWIEGEACFNFGKAKGKRLRDVVATDRGLLEWMLNPERAFSPEVKAIVRNALDGRFPIRT